MRQSSTISRLRCARQPSNKEGWYQAVPIKTRVDKQFTSRPSSSMDKQQNNKNKASTTLHVSPRRDLEGAQQEDFKFYHTLHGCVIFFNTISKKYITKVTHIWEKTETYARIRGAVAHIPSKRALMSAPWTKSTSIAQAVGKDALPSETPRAIQQPGPQNKVALDLKQGNPRPPEQREL